MQKKTLHVVNIIEEGRLGGPQIRIVQVAKGLRDHGVETTVICPRMNGKEFARLLQEAKTPYVQIPLLRLSRSISALLSYALFFPVEIFLLWRLFKQNRFDLVHVSGGCWQFKGLFAAKLAGIPSLWHLNDTGMPRLLLMLFKFLVRRLPAGLIVAAARVQGYYLKNLELGDLPVHEVQAPVDTTKFTPGLVTPDPTITAHEGLSIATVCSVNPDKDIATLLRVAALVGKRRADIRFFVIGPTHKSQLKYKSKIDALAAKLDLDNVTFTGSTSDVRAALEAADIYLCTSAREASPLSVWEAMSMKLPIVSTDVGDVSRFLIDGQCGNIVPVEDAQALAQAVLHLADDAVLRNDFGTQARQAAKEHLDVAIIAKRQAEVYAKAMQKAHSTKR